MCESAPMTRSSLLFVLLLAPSTLWAHAALVKSAPAQRAVLYRAPAKIELWFNERLEPRYSSLSLSDADGKPVETGKAEVNSEDLKRLSAAIRPLPPGRYLIKYRVLSVDGHIVQDQFPFTVKQ
jgi:methionine-rich copper-binding protein CopC